MKIKRRPYWVDHTKFRLCEEETSSGMRFEIQNLAHDGKTWITSTYNHQVCFSPYSPTSVFEVIINRNDFISFFLGYENRVKQTREQGWKKVEQLKEANV